MIGDLEVDRRIGGDHDPSSTRIALLVLAGAGLLAARESATAQAAKPTVAIMYFNNNVFTKDARDYDGLTKGVPDFLVSEMASNPNIRVIERDQVQKLHRRAEADVAAARSTARPPSRSESCSARST